MAKALTVKAIEQAKAGTSRREIPDVLVPGLYLVVQPSGAKSWAVRYRWQGKPAKLTIGPVLVLDKGAEEPPAVLGAPATLVGARTLARAALADVAAGKNPAEMKRQAKALANDAERAERDSFGKAAIEFVEKHHRARARRAGRSDRGWLEAARQLGIVPDPESDEADPKRRPLIARKGGLADRWRKRRIQDITRRDIMEELERLVAANNPVAANRLLANLHKFFNWLVDRQAIPANPASGIKKLVAERSRDRVLSDPELKLLWSACDSIGDPFGPLVKTLILTGQRRDEVAGMRWSELDLEAGIWTLPRSRTKKDEPHTVPLAPAVVDLLSGLPRIGKAGYVFTTNGENHVTGYSRAKDRLDRAILEAMQAEAGADPEAVEPLADWRIHDLRRTLASGMARLGQPVHVVEAVLNHKTGSIRGVAAVYNRYSYAPEKRRALEAWASHVQAVVGEKPAAENVVEMWRAAE